MSERIQRREKARAKARRQRERNARTRAQRSRSRGDDLGAGFHDQAAEFQRDAVAESEVMIEADRAIQGDHLND